MGGYHQMFPGSEVALLTPREREILAWLSSDLSPRKIAERLVLAPSSVKWYTRQIYAKLGVCDRQQAVVRAKALGILDEVPSQLHSMHRPEANAGLLPWIPVQRGPDGQVLFVDRECELRKLIGFLDRALAGEGQAIFIAGNAGDGKTALLHEFTRLALNAHPELVAAQGNCTVCTGAGDPYLPFHEILVLLTGDTAACPSIGQEQSRRLSRTLPLAAEGLVKTAPDLMGSFIAVGPLLERLQELETRPEKAGWVFQINQMMERTRMLNAGGGSTLTALFAQYTRLLRWLADHHPLLLILDDLQWADPGSIDLLFHLAQNLNDARILVAGAFRPVDVALGRNGDRHPLEKVINELRSRSGEIELDLECADGHHFVDSFLDAEPNDLDVFFRNRLYREMEGQPLATVEFVRSMRECGGLLKDSACRWMEGPALDWDILPARVEAMVAERMGRLDETSLDLLRAASVEGENFTVEVLAEVLGAEQDWLRSHLSGKLDRTHRLVKARGISNIDGRVLSVYRFRHHVFQRYLYNSLDPVERTHLQQAVESAVRSMYGDATKMV